MTPNETEAAEASPPIEVREALRSLEGRWTVRDLEESFTEVCELFPGGHHLVCYATSQKGDEVSRHMSIITWSAEERCFLYFGIGSAGSVRRLRGDYDGGVWTFTGSALIDGAPASVRDVMTPHEEGYRFLEQHSFDGAAWITDSEFDYLRISEPGEAPEPE